MGGRKQYGSSGLGLFISKSICQTMGGSLEAHSQVGVGTCFSVRFPCGGFFGGVRKESAAIYRFKDLKDVSFRVGLRLTPFQADVFVGRHMAANFPRVQFLAIGSLLENPEYIKSMDRLVIDHELVETHEWQEILPLIGDIPTLVLVNYESVTTQFTGHSNIIITAKPLHPSYMYQFLGAISDFEFGSQAGPATPTLTRSSGSLQPVPSPRRMVSILVVDDVEMNRRVAVRLLKRVFGETHLQVDTANDGFEAVEYFVAKAGDYDCILMDIMMPQCDGFEALALIRDREKSFDGHTPVVALTAGAGDMLELAQNKFDRTLCKPFTLNGLLDVLEELGLPVKRTKK